MMAIRFYSIFLLFLIISCDKSPSFKEKGPVYGPSLKGLHNFDGLFRAEKNKVPFEGDVKFTNHFDICVGCYSLGFHTFEDSLEQKEYFVLYNLNLFKLGKYEVHRHDVENHENGDGLGLQFPTTTFYYTNIEDDGLEGDTYALYDDYPNWVEIISLDSVTNTIKGTFLLHYEKYIENDLSNPKNIKFSNVEFEVKID